jgi:hypothetical protein
MDTTSEIINVQNIVSSDVGEIRIDPQFKELYNFGQFEMDILTAAIQADTGQTEFQSTHFVANSQITPFKQVKQCLMELEVRYHAYQEIRASLRKAEIMRLKWLKTKEEMTDELDKELIQIDIEKNDYDITIWKRKLRQSEYEMNAFMNIVKKYATSSEELEYYKAHNEEEERKYWIARMGKQAAMDIIAFGRVGSGNMDSIAMMDADAQLESLTMAVQYSGLINAGLHKISVSSQETVDKYLASKNTEIPELLNNLYNDQNIQLTSQPKVKSESI